MIFLFKIDSTSRQQISIVIEYRNNTINQLGLNDIYRTFTKQLQKTFTNMDYILSYNINLNTFRKTKLAFLQTMSLTMIETIKRPIIVNYLNIQVFANGK